MAVGSGPSKLLVGGFRAADPSFEQYWVRPGGATVLAIAPDDRFTVIDVDGGQVAEVTMLAPDGTGRGRGDRRAGRRTRDRAFGRSSPRWSMARGRSCRTSPAAGWTRAARWRSGCSASGRRRAPSSRSGPIGRSCSSWPPRPAGSSTALPRRATSSSRCTGRGRGPSEEVELPPPLAEPRLDFRIDRSTARSYEVQAGEFIQVIDVEGKQCSDFLAFHRRKLDDGIERGLDATVTRTLMGNAYPTPGLSGKFYDADMDPLVEVVRDTVGRHDTFALACNAKYYEDMGYPGHVNCTDNFNGTLTVYEIAKRKGWPALNFFFNTAFTADNVLVSDEPWSRPGDYVLLRAMTDLVCASSACPDDVDPANAWNPTDVHVRVYSPEHRFSAAIAHRVTPEARPVLTQKTGFHPRIEALTKNLVEYNGYWLPSHFYNEGAIAEYWACREHAAIMDLSPLRKFEVLGPDAEALLQATITRDARRLSVGQVTYTAVCNEAGGMIDDATVFRLGQDNFRFVGGDDYDGVWLKEQAGAARAARRGSSPRPTSSTTSPSRDRRAARSCDEVVWTPPTQTSLDELGWFRFLVGRVRRARRDPDRGLADRLHRRARLRGLVPSRRRRGRLGRDLGGGRAARARRRSAWTRSTSCGSRPG